MKPSLGAVRQFFCVVTAGAVAAVVGEPHSHEASHPHPSHDSQKRQTQAEANRERRIRALLVSSSSSSSSSATTTTEQQQQQKQATVVLASGEVQRIPNNSNKNNSNTSRNDNSTNKRTTLFTHPEEDDRTLRNARSAASSSSSSPFLHEQPPPSHHHHYERCHPDLGALACPHYGQACQQLPLPVLLEDDHEYKTIIRQDPEGGGWYCLKQQHEVVVTMKRGTSGMTAATRAADDASLDGDEDLDDDDDKEDAESLEWQSSRHHRRLLEAATTEQDDPHQQSLYQQRRRLEEPPNGPIYDECSTGYTYNFDSTLYAPSGWDRCVCKGYENAIPKPESVYVTGENDEVEFINYCFQINRFYCANYYGLEEEEEEEADAAARVFEYDKPTSYDACLCSTYDGTVPFLQDEQPEFCTNFPKRYCDFRYDGTDPTTLQVRAKCLCEKFGYDYFCPFATNPPTPGPTAQPTPAPSRAPTQSPTRGPSHSPTKSPTPNPTRDPTRFPTKQPSRKPTKKPTKSPTNNPTQKPTVKPSVGPTVTPTAPKNDPSKEPTLKPSKSPTNNKPTATKVSSTTPAVPRPTGASENYDIMQSSKEHIPGALPGQDQRYRVPVVNSGGSGTGGANANDNTSSGNGREFTHFVTKGTNPYVRPPVSAQMQQQEQTRPLLTPQDLTTQIRPVPAGTSNRPPPLQTQAQQQQQSYVRPQDLITRPRPVSEEEPSLIQEVRPPPLQQRPLPLPETTAGQRDYAIGSITRPGSSNGSVMSSGSASSSFASIRQSQRSHPRGRQSGTRRELQEQRPVTGLGNDLIMEPRPVEVPRSPPPLLANDDPRKTPVRDSVTMTSRPLPFTDSFQDPLLKATEVPRPTPVITKQISESIGVNSKVVPVTEVTLSEKDRNIQNSASNGFAASSSGEDGNVFTRPVGVEGGLPVMPGGGSYAVEQEPVPVITQILPDGQGYHSKVVPVTDVTTSEYQQQTPPVRPIDTNGSASSNIESKQQQLMEERESWTESTKAKRPVTFSMDGVKRGGFGSAFSRDSNNGKRVRARSSENEEQESTKKIYHHHHHHKRRHVRDPQKK